VLGATDRRLRAVVAQVPTISGFEQGLRRVAPEGIAGLERAFAEDDRGQLRGEPLRRQLVVSDDVLLDPPLWSSPRRFRRLGNWRTTLLNVTFIGLFYFGVDP
jgi:hypothetical protein